MNTHEYLRKKWKDLLIGVPILMITWGSVMHLIILCLSVLLPYLYIIKPINPIL